MTLNLKTRTADAMALTKEVTEKWTSRLAGSDACLACGDYLQEIMQHFCDTTAIQDFSVRPGAFLGYLRIEVALFVCGLLALYLQQVAVAALLALLILLIVSFEFLFYYEFVDFLFPRKQGKNIVGTIEPDGVVKQQIIVSAHHDSAHIFNFLAKDPKSYDRKIIAGFASILAMVLVTWLLLVLSWAGVDLPVLYWALTGLLTATLLFVLPIWSFYAAEGTPGAGDNMVCTAIAIEVGKHFAQKKAQGNGLQHTRVVVASWDAEEAGLRGARRYIQQHKDDLLQVKTYNFNLECMYDHHALAFLTSDLNSFVPLSADMANECVQIADQLGYNVTTAKFPLLAGGTDAAEFAKAGIEATTLAAMNWFTRGEEPAYHTLRDTVDAVDPVAVEQSIAIGITYIIGKERQLTT